MRAPISFAIWDLHQPRSLWRPRHFTVHAAYTTEKEAWLFACSTGLFVGSALCHPHGPLTPQQTFDLYDSALSSWPSAEATNAHTLGAVDIVEKDGEFLIVADTPGVTPHQRGALVKDNRTIQA